MRLRPKLALLSALVCAVLVSCGTQTWLPAEPTTSTSQDELRLQGDQILDAAGKPIALHGLNWFGFNNQSTMVDGLWGGPALALDFASVVYRQQLLGFNAIRLPFSFKDLLTLPPRNYVQNCTLPAPADVAASVTAPGKSPISPVPPQHAPPTRHSGQCNEYLPNDSTFNRFVWVVNFYTHNGFYVLIDNHLREDQSALQDPAAWAADWVKLVQALVADPITKSHLFVDLLNEPDNFGITWEGGNGKPALKDLYLSAMDAIHTVAPQQIFFVEGTGQGNLQSNWGDGFCTNGDLIKQYGLSDPRAFFDALAGKPYASQVVISPHVYGPQVTTNAKASTGPDLWARLSNSFGTLTRAGYKNAKFPVAVGEFGSRFTAADDVATMTDLRTYLLNQGAAKDGAHNAIDHWFYWCWNANSGDTGGIVADDWLTLQWQKVNYLQGLGLGAKGTTPVPPSPAPSPNPNTPTPSPAPSPNPNTPTHPPAPAPSPSTSTCAVVLQIQQPWQQAGVYQTVINVQVSNQGAQDIAAPWTLALKNDAYTGVVQAWNWQPMVSNGGIRGVASEVWETLTKNGGNTVTVGAVVSLSRNTDLSAESATLNGAACRITVQQNL